MDSGGLLEIALKTVLPQFGFSLVFLYMMSKLWQRIVSMQDKLLDAFKENAVAINNNTAATKSLERTLNGEK